MNQAPDSSKSEAIGNESQCRVSEVSRKKVLYLITKATWGGAQKYVFDLATHLPQEKFAVSVAYGEGGRSLEMLKEKSIETHRIPALGRDVAVLSDVASFFQIVRLLRRVRPDVLHVNSSKAAALGALAGHLCGIRRIIFTAHGWPFKEDRNTLARAAIYFISWFTALLSNATIVVSKRDEEIGKRMWLAGKKIHYVPLGIAMPHFLPRAEARHALTSRRGLAVEESWIVSVAELTPNKGIKYAIEAIALLKERDVKVSYFIIGDGELHDELEKLAQERSVADCVHFLGFVHEASKYLKAFDVFLLPSLKEGMPYVLLEAMAAGLPIVATDVIDPSFAENDPNITLVPLANPLVLADALERAIEQPAKNTPPKTYSLAQMIEKTSGLY